jgi:hypothetical protein
MISTAGTQNAVKRFPADSSVCDMASFLQTRPAIGAIQNERATTLQAVCVSRYPVFIVAGLAAVVKFSLHRDGKFFF